MGFCPNCIVQVIGIFWPDLADEKLSRVQTHKKSIGQPRLGVKDKKDGCEFYVAAFVVDFILPVDTGVDDVFHDIISLPLFTTFETNLFVPAIAPIVAAALIVVILSISKYAMVPMDKVS